MRWAWILAILTAAGGAVAYAVTRPFGALKGVVRFTSSKPAVGITWYLKTGNEGSERYAGDFDFVVVKTTDGQSRKSGDQYRELVAQADDAGTPVHAWSYCYATDPDRARKEGKAAAEAALAIGARAQWINCEHQWAGGYSGEAGAADPFTAMEALVLSFRAHAPGIPVVFNSTTSWMSPRLDAEADRAIASLFDAYGPMVYSSGSDGGRKTMRRKWERGYKVAIDVGIPFVPLLGSGREDYNVAGRYWSNLDTAHELQREMPADWITFWIAPNGGDRIYAANALNPSLIDFAERA
jgi:hypothetical protein